MFLARTGPLLKDNLLVFFVVARSLSDKVYGMGREIWSEKA